MLIETSSDLIVSSHVTQLANGTCVDAATLLNGCVLTISCDGLALYRHLDALQDPLGNGLIRSVALTAEACLPDCSPLILEYRAGYVGLEGGFVLLIGLNDVRLFACKQDALSNTNELQRLSLQYQ
ncbi:MULTISPECIES: hypothetical protein [unclassified Oceanobacter]|uniref:hypothetical protein n=1 Tax=unclassified Oceanobacter TaxID=2620260 RepID=UPI0026E3F890|nr:MULTISPECIES: hypothetical protein [unclassified Oceanobacter]MDO6681619.1 hypothetical protein [Oceanobacter sp. 5_MG-2023]MDP2505753.1 hypothetical protein [Oceanobacter sp. 3_MG-2023]MDP2547420.1 hypothetical protein [Oceanobacter sp. 4_MG-2023]MDP2608208.1 hypothetical protein [Oceanobacter sp. 1_MG-2023]MDP2612934.1 hypothetical protein [Oceanobacter sp. 2_MG-2023]